MGKALRLPLLSLILLISLTTICLAEEKTDLDIFDLIKHAPFFGHAFNTEEFTYIGIYYPSFIYQEQIDRLTVDLEKIDERTVRYKFELDCPPFLALKNEIKVEGTVFTPIQPKNYSSVDLNTICTFIGTTGKKPLFNQIGGNLKKWIYPDWSLHMPKPESVPLGPGEREDLMKMTLEFYLRQVQAEMTREGEKKEAEQKTNLAQSILKDMELYGLPEDPRVSPIITWWLRPVSLPDQRFATIDVPLIRFLKKEIIEPNIINLITTLPFRPDRRKVYFCVYLPTRDCFGVFGNRVLLQYELGLTGIELPRDSPQLKEKY